MHGWPSWLLWPASLPDGSCRAGLGATKRHGEDTHLPAVQPSPRTRTIGSINQSWVQPTDDSARSIGTVKATSPEEHFRCQHAKCMRFHPKKCHLFVGQKQKRGKFIPIKNLSFSCYATSGKWVGKILIFSKTFGTLEAVRRPWMTQKFAQRMSFPHEFWQNQSYLKYGVKTMKQIN